MAAGMEAGTSGTGQEEAFKTSESGCQSDCLAALKHTSVAGGR
jgi:hypothetical protein